MIKFSYLLPYVHESDAPPAPDQNRFYSLERKDILDAESTMGIQFPEQLKNFYQEIGYGFFRAPQNPPPDHKFYGTNRLSDPLTTALLYKAIEYFHNDPQFDYYKALEDGAIISHDTLELLEVGDLPFFEIGDSSSFMVMKLHSENPNAIWSDCGVKIEDSFERFVWRLYYESPGYYGPIIEAHYAALEK